MFLPATKVIACPFCTALQPTWAQLRERSPVVALAEVVKQIETQSRDESRLALVVYQVFQGDQRLKPQATLQLKLAAPSRTGSLLILFAAGKDEKLEDLSWTAVPTNEHRLAYFARSPSPREKQAGRLGYFVRYLEDSDPLVAEDAWQEFGHAPFDVVRQVADRFDPALLRRWLADAGARQHRQGFYGAALGIAPAATIDGLSNAEFLKERMLAPGSDFRAGFDGLVAGYLLAAGEQGLDVVEKQLLANPKAAVVDVRQAMAALRFCHLYDKSISSRRLAGAMRKLLSRDAFAAEAIADLARWRDWEALPGVLALFDAPSEHRDEIRRAVVGFLLVCPEKQAADALARLRRANPQAVADAQRQLEATGSSEKQ